MVGLDLVWVNFYPVLCFNYSPAMTVQHGKRLRLNKFGKIFFGRVERSFNELSEGQRELADLAKLDSGNITVGAISSRLLPNLLTEYLTNNPHGQFRLRQITKQTEIQKCLMNSEIDLCLSLLPINHPEIRCLP